tara:strand:- start:743 stop:1507 length:765 start_codon:yes stop_codon:yes gene_type:complete
MIIKNNFIRLCFGINILLYSLFVESKEFDYKFYWLSLPVAKLSINFSEPSYVNNIINRSDIEFQLSTQGPLKLYRDYSSEGSIKNNNATSWDYYLFGQDRGQPEEKLITYFIGNEPVIKKFIDDTGISSISIDPYLDQDAIDPFSVLIETIKQLTFEQQCNNQYSVMDGKRRYKVGVELFERKVNSSKAKIGLEDIVYNCIFTLSRVMKEKKKWPFNRNDRSMNIWFSSKLDFKPIRFQVKTPIGTIVGKYVID